MNAESSSNLPLTCQNITTKKKLSDTHELLIPTMNIQLENCVIIIQTKVL